MPATATDRLYGLQTSVAIKPACRVATTVNITLSGLQVVDGVTVVAGDRVLVKSQTDPIDNGIYEANTSTWSRAPDFDGARDAVNGTLVIVRAGSINARTVWELTAPDPVAIGSDELTFEPALLEDSATAAFLAAGLGATQRTAQDKGRDFYSVLDTVSREDVDGVTSNQIKIAAAVAHCYANGLDLYWPHPGAAYVSTASIPNFHEVRHFGPGRILRGTDTFYVDPREGQSNTLYVNPTGSASNDGLSASQPIATMAAVFTALNNFGPVLKGTWTVQLAASVAYDWGVTLRGLKTENRLVIAGPTAGHPNVPTAKVFPGAPAASGWRFGGAGLNVEVRDIALENFDSSASAFAIAAVDGADVEYRNVHVTDSTLGIVGNNLAIFGIYGGIIAGCDEGVRSLFGCKHTIGTGTLSNDPIIKNCLVGFSARESSSGHAWANFQDNDFGMDVQANARVNASGSDFKRNVVAIRMRDGNVLHDGATFNTGTADANGMNLRIQQGGVDLSAAPYANQPRIEVRDFTSSSVTGTIAETTLKTVTLGKDDFLAVNGSTYWGKRVRVIARGTIVGTAGTKQFRARLGGTAIAGLLAVAGASSRYEFVVDLYITARTSQRIHSALTVDAQSAEISSATTAVDLGSGADTALTVTVELANVADQVTVDLLEVEVDG